MMITVSLTVEEFKALEQLAQFRACLDSETLLRCVVGDLVHSTWTGGSDERMYAHQWLDRRFGSACYARELAEERNKVSDFGPRLAVAGVAVSSPIRSAAVMPSASEQRWMKSRVGFFAERSE